MTECMNVISKIPNKAKPSPLKGSKHRAQRLLPQFHTAGYTYQEPPCPLHRNDHAAHPKEARLLWRPSLPFSSRLSIQGAGRETRTQLWPLPDPPTPSSRNARAEGEWASGASTWGRWKGAGKTEAGSPASSEAGERGEPAPPPPSRSGPPRPCPGLRLRSQPQGEADQARGSAASQLDGLVRGTQPPRAGR